MSDLLIDIGNTNFKWCVRGAGESAEGVGSSGEPYETSIARLAASLPRPQRIGLACVKSDVYQQEMIDALRRHFALEPFVAHVSLSDCGLINSYQEPARMGVDRWLAMIGARPHLSGAFCVVDCGSAVTIDWVAASGQHLGGFILAGLRLSVKALLAGTDQVIVDYDKLATADVLPGASTTDAVYNGALFALVAQVEAAYQHLVRVSEGEACHLIVTGGDAGLVSEHLAVPCRIMRGLVFDGLEFMMNAGAR